MPPVAVFAAALALGGCGGTSHAGSKAALHPSGPQTKAPSSGTSQGGRRGGGSATEDSANGGDRRSRARHRGGADNGGAIQSFRAAAQAACEGLSKGASVQAPNVTGQRGSGALSIYQAQQRAFRMYQAIQALLRLRPPRSIRAPFTQLIYGLRQLQGLQLMSTQPHRGSAAASSAAIARAQQLISSTATAVGLPACANVGAAASPQTGAASPQTPGAPLPRTGAPSSSSSPVQPGNPQSRYSPPRYTMPGYVPPHTASAPPAHSQRGR